MSSKASGLLQIQQPYLKANPITRTIISGRLNRLKNQAGSAQSQGTQQQKHQSSQSKGSPPRVKQDSVKKKQPQPVKVKRSLVIVKSEAVKTKFVLPTQTTATSNPQRIYQQAQGSGITPAAFSTCQLKNSASASASKQPRMPFKEQAQVLDSKIKQHFQYNLMHTNHISDGPNSNGNNSNTHPTLPAAVMTKKIQKKTQIDGLLQLRKGGYENKYAADKNEKAAQNQAIHDETGLELLKRKFGCQGGDGLGDFVKERLRQEEENRIKKQIEQGLNAIRLISEVEGNSRKKETIINHWSKKLAEIQQLITVNKYDVKMPKQLEKFLKKKTDLEVGSLHLAQIEPMIRNRRMIQSSGAQFRINRQKDKFRHSTSTAERNRLHNDATDTLEHTVNTLHSRSIILSAKNILNDENQNSIGSSSSPGKLGKSQQRLKRMPSRILIGSNSARLLKQSLAEEDYKDESTNRGPKHIEDAKLVQHSRESPELTMIKFQAPTQRSQTSDQKHLLIIDARQEKDIQQTFLAMNNSSSTSTVMNRSTRKKLSSVRKKEQPLLVTGVPKMIQIQESRPQTQPGEKAYMVKQEFKQVAVGAEYNDSMSAHYRQTSSILGLNLDFPAQTFQTQQPPQGVEQQPHEVPEDEQRYILASIRREGEPFADIQAIAIDSLTPILQMTSTPQDDTIEEQKLISLNSQSRQIRQGKYQTTKSASIDQKYSSVHNTNTNTIISSNAYLPPAAQSSYPKLQTASTLNLDSAADRPDLIESDQMQSMDEISPEKRDQQSALSQKDGEKDKKLKYIALPITSFPFARTDSEKQKFLQSSQHSLHSVAPAPTTNVGVKKRAIPVSKKVESRNLRQRNFTSQNVHKTEDQAIENPLNQAVIYKKIAVKSGQQQKQHRQPLPKDLESVENQPLKSPGQICIQTKNTNSVEKEKEEDTKIAAKGRRDRKAIDFAKERQKVQSALFIREKNNNSSVDLSAGMRYFQRSSVSFLKRNQSTNHAANDRLLSERHKSTSSLASGKNTRGTHQDLHHYQNQNRPIITANHRNRHEPGSPLNMKLMLAIKLSPKSSKMLNYRNRRRSKSKKQMKLRNSRKLQKMRQKMAQRENMPNEGDNDNFSAVEIDQQSLYYPAGQLQQKHQRQSTPSEHDLAVNDTQTANTPDRHNQTLLIPTHDTVVSETKSVYKKTSDQQTQYRTRSQKSSTTSQHQNNSDERINSGTVEIGVSNYQNMVADTAAAGQQAGRTISSTSKNKGAAKISNLSSNSQQQLRLKVTKITPTRNNQVSKLGFQTADDAIEGISNLQSNPSHQKRISGNLAPNLEIAIQHDPKSVRATKINESDSKFQTVQPNHLVMQNLSGELVPAAAAEEPSVTISHTDLGVTKHLASQENPSSSIEAVVLHLTNKLQHKSQKVKDKNETKRHKQQSSVVVKALIKHQKSAVTVHQPFERDRSEGSKSNVAQNYGARAGVGVWAQNYHHSASISAANRANDEPLVIDARRIRQVAKPDQLLGGVYGQSVSGQTRNNQTLESYQHLQQQAQTQTNLTPIRSRQFSSQYSYTEPDYNGPSTYQQDERFFYTTLDDANVYKDQDTSIIMPFKNAKSQGKSRQLHSQKQRRQPSQQMSIQTLSFESSMEEESNRREQREQLSKESQELKGGITKTGGFRRPSSLNSFYQVKKHSQNGGSFERQRRAAASTQQQDKQMPMNADLISLDQKHQASTTSQGIVNNDTATLRRPNEEGRQYSTSRHMMHKSISTEFIQLETENDPSEYD